MDASLLVITSSMVIEGGLSSSVMVSTPFPSKIVAFAGPLKLTEIVSFGSSNAS